jgi:antitoxin CptB
LSDGLPNTPHWAAPSSAPTANRNDSIYLYTALAAISYGSVALSASNRRAKAPTARFAVEELRAVEPQDIRIKRLRYRSSYTGTKETDVLLGQFAARHLAELSADMLDQYEALIENSDPDLFMWISGRKPVPPEWDTEIMALLKKFRTGL